MTRITVAVCTYNRYDVLSKAIESLIKQTLSTDEYQVLIVDNSSDLELAQQKKQEYENLPLVQYLIERTPGLSNARNVAAKGCGTEFIAYMDDDAIASPGWLAEILSGFDQFGPNVGVVGGKVEPIWEIDCPKWLENADRSIKGLVSVVDWGGETRVAADGEWFAGANIAFRTQAVLDNGGFEVSLGRNGGGAVLLSNEELQLLDLLKEKGYLSVYVPEAKVQHLVEKHRLTRTWFRKRIVWQAISNYMTNSEEMMLDAKHNWQDLVPNYFSMLPPRERTVRGLFHETDDPQQFADQLWVLLCMTTLMMSGFENID